MTSMIRTYRELQKLISFEERYQYLKLKGIVGESTFGFDRYLNQMLYRSRRWQRVRNEVIIRDSACDLGILDREIFDRVIVHHMNPISLEDIENENDEIFNPNFLISTSYKTHLAIHYGDDSLLSKQLIVRQTGDTKLWR